MLPFHASLMVHPDGAREQGAAHRQRDPEEGVGLFCPSGDRPPVPQMIAFIEKHLEACGVEPVAPWT